MHVDRYGALLGLQARREPVPISSQQEFSVEDKTQLRPTVLHSNQDILDWSIKLGLTIADLIHFNTALAVFL